jgi:uncharacterized protein (TIRG00374 family)
LPVLGIAISIVILAIVASLFNFNISIVLSINPFYFLLALASSLLVLLVQGLRFRFIIDTFTDKGPFKMRESIIVRIGSQFVAMTTPAYVGGEVARAAWLATKGIPAGTALWLPYIEIIFDVYSTGLFSFLAGIIALNYGRIFLGTILTLLSAIMLFLMTLVIFLSRSERLRIPNFLKKMAIRILGEKRGNSMIEKADTAIMELKQASRVTLTKKNIKHLFYISIYTTILALLTGSSLFFIAKGLGLNVDLYQSLLAVFASVILGNLPITFGGAGLAEAGVYYYSSLVLGVSSWPMVFAWRLASYIIPLAITGLSATITLRRYINSKG